MTDDRPVSFARGGGPVCVHARVCAQDPSRMAAELHAYVRGMRARVQRTCAQLY